jgi:hypothetical protein
MGIVKGIGKARDALNGPCKGARRFALGLNGEALPRAPASFTLRQTRFAGSGIVCGICGRRELKWWASR